LIIASTFRRVMSPIVRRKGALISAEEAIHVAFRGRGYRSVCAA
jgi:hypothetical protein